MPPKSVRGNLVFYHKKLSRKTVHVPCRYCKKDILPKDYENHVSKVHDFNVKLGCAWCGDHFWKSSEKHANVPHLLTCYEKHSRRLPTPPTPPPRDTQNLKSLRLEHLHPEKNHFGSIALRIHKRHEFNWPLDIPDDPFPLFQDDNLNLAAAYVRRFREMRGTHTWFHIYVKVVAMPSFVKAMNKDFGTTRTLLFSCWCDGGPYEDPRHRQHRHMIAVSPKGHFMKHVWHKVCMKKRDRPDRHFPCKGMRRIKSALHLVNALGYVSHRKFGCKFASKETASELYHFYIYKTLPVDFKLPLALLCDGGLQELLYEQKYQNVSVSRLIEKPLSLIGGQWKQKIKHFYNYESGLVVPVSKGLMPTREVGQEAPLFTFYLLGGEKIYFNYSQENESLGEEAWLRKQAEGGNCFYDVVEDEFWTLRRSVQAALSNLMPFVERRTELESENADLKVRCEDLEKRCEDLEKRYEAMEKRYEAMERETQATLDEMSGRYKEEMVIMGMESSKMERESREKLDEVKGQYEEELTRMKTEIDSLKMEVDSLKMENASMKMEKTISLETKVTFF